MKLKNKRGFTLIELLVVGLIIGILAAVALPQYNKTVEKSLAANIFPVLKDVALAQNAYYLTHGSYAEKFQDLDVNIPLTGTSAGYHYFNDTLSNTDWSLQLSRKVAGGHDGFIFVTRLRGPYAGGGFNIDSRNFFITCKERPTFKATPGSYCEKIFNATKSPAQSDTRSYYLP